MSSVKRANFNKVHYGSFSDNEEEIEQSRIRDLKAEQELNNMSCDMESGPENNENIAINQPCSTCNEDVIIPDNDETVGQTRHGPHPHKKFKRTPSTPYLEERLQRKLKFFFMGPHEKYMAKKKCPWKLILQIIKVIIVTVQLVMFGSERSLFVDYVEKNNVALKHLYLKGWDNSYETMPYPPATGQYAVYTFQDLLDSINYATKQYNQTESLSLAVFQLIENDTAVNPMELCSEHYSGGYVYRNGSFSQFSEKYNDCEEIYPIQIYNATTKTFQDKYDVYQYLADRNKTYMFHRIIKMNLKFKIRSFRLNAEGKKLAPECFMVHGKIVYDDSNRDGQMLIQLLTDLEERTCHGNYDYDNDEKIERIAETAYDCVVIIVSVLSSVLCLRSLYRGQRLRCKTVEHFKKVHRKSLTGWEKFEFLNLWYVAIVINDIFTIVGSAFKIQIENKNAQSTSKNYDNCSLFLGTGSILVWLGVLRYMGFFKTFNILSLVLKKAFPNMIRFLAGALMLYVGFLFCGWVVLGPYHLKFRTLSSSSECLFSLINGDDMFVTFSATVTKNDIVWYFSRIYLYLFISLFIYAVLNLFIAVILDTYETIKRYYEEGFPTSDLQKFIDECHDHPSSPLYRGEDHGGCGLLSRLCLCCKGNADQPKEYTPLLK